MCQQLYCATSGVDLRRDVTTRHIEQCQCLEAHTHTRRTVSFYRYLHRYVYTYLDISS